MILSKSTNNKILLWMPDLSNAKKVRVANYTPPDDVTVLRTFRLRNCNLWFMRFAIDNMGKYLACGMLNGEVEIWNIDESTSEEPCQRLPYIEEATMRMLAFSPDGNFLVGCTDDASICRWNLR
jgi:WD40 repeat protein